jgi:hypothetical protein
MKECMREQVRKQGWRIALHVEELESRRLLSAANFLSLGFGSGIHLAFEQAAARASQQAFPVRLTAATELTPSVVPRQLDLAPEALFHGAGALGRSVEPSATVPFNVSEPRISLPTESVTRAPVQTVPEPAAPTFLIEFGTEAVQVSITQVVSVVVNRVPAAPEPASAPVAPSPEPSVAAEAAAAAVPVRVAPSGSTVVAAQPAVLAAARVTSTPTATPRVTGAPPVPVVPGQTSAVPLAGGAPAVVNAAGPGAADNVASVRLLNRAPESGGGNAPGAENWPPATLVAGSGAGAGGVAPTMAEAAGTAAGWREALDATFARPVWDAVAGVFGSANPAEPAGGAANLLDPLAGAAALGMLLGAYWGGQPVDRELRRRQFFRQL